MSSSPFAPPNALRRFKAHFKTQKAPRGINILNGKNWVDRQYMIRDFITFANNHHAALIGETTEITNIVNRELNPVMSGQREHCQADEILIVAWARIMKRAYDAHPEEYNAHKNEFEVVRGLESLNMKLLSRDAKWCNRFQNWWHRRREEGEADRPYFPSELSGPNTRNASDARSKKNVGFNTAANETH